MKVFRVKSDVNICRWLMPEVAESEILELNTFNCRPRLHQWEPPRIFEYDPPSKTGDFAYYHPAALLASPSAANRVRPFFERAGEVLPLWFDGDQYTLVNITECISALDELKSEWLRGQDGSKVEIRRYCFNPTKFGESSLFKIPETCQGSVLTWERDKSPESEFKAFVEQKGLTGLLFDELWDSENEN